VSDWEYDDLASRYPWPDKQPGDQGVKTVFGWLHELTREALASQLNASTRLVVELGTWLGKSTRFILGHAPDARIVCIDHWEGSPEIRQHHGHLFGEPVYKAFLHHNWDLRARIIPVRLASVDGVRECRHLKPDLVYVDAAHDAESVKRDVEACATAWPDAVLVGDDWEVSSTHYDVATGVADALNATDRDYDLHNNGKAWWATRV